jgi:hypothetical protein
MSRSRAQHEPKVDPEVRAFLIAETFRFVDVVSTMTGITRIALVGSLTTEKDDPKDADLLVTVADDLDLGPLAAASRRLKGAAQTKGKGADVFLANPSGQYIGRICHWRECGPGIRTSCDASHCGRRHYLHDDFDDITLNNQLLAEPPIEVWPQVVCRTTVPPDLMLHLSQPQAKASQ